MLTHTQDQTYFDRMASSLGDKMVIFPYLEGNRILDMGAGGGELAHVMAQGSREVWALDGSLAATQRMTHAYPELHVLVGMAHELPLMTDVKFTTVVCSSIFHEVYSYGDASHGPYSLEALRATLGAIYNQLEPGGRLVIRDGVMPAEWDKVEEIHFTTDEGMKFWEHYAANAPFVNWHGQGGQRTVALEPVGPRTLRGNRASLMEFIYTYTWGWQSSARECKELYGLFTQEDYCKVLESVGFTLESAGEYVQPGYREALDEKLMLKDLDGQAVGYPATNCLWVARKPQD